jgi:glycogen debranching enzyme
VWTRAAWDVTSLASKSGIQRRWDIAIEVTVGPPLITITRGSTFVVAEPDGCITAYTDQGIYSHDTRYVSNYETFADGERWVLQNSGAIAYYASRAYLTNPRIITEYGDIEPGTLSFDFSRAVHDGVHEDLEIQNFSMKRVRFSLEISLRTDFADIFEVKTKRVLRKGNVTTEWNQETLELLSSYEHDGFQRSLSTRVIHSRSPVSYSNGRISFLLDLGPRDTWHSCLQHLMNKPAGSLRRVHHCVHLLRSPESRVEAGLRDWKSVTTSVTTSNEDVYRLFTQSVEDMAALRLHPEAAQTEYIPAAGVPWFVAVFGRDSLIVSLQNMVVYPDFARSALDILGRLQATEIDDYRDAQPGKILHEIRVGELAQRKLIPHTPYYGTADATALYLITLHEAWKWLGDDRLFHAHEETAKRCLKWIDAYGDLDGDGFQEYQTRSPQGYENVGWKDAPDSVMYPDGSLVKGPKALCELQGYTYDAWSRMAQLFEHFNQLELASDLRRKAAALQQKFEERFWCEETGFYAYALDGDKKQVRTVVSNPGHLLWSGMVSRERAFRVITRLLKPDMWSGWGIRTLSAECPAYNPFSYQNGSVWPHDNGIIAMGCKRYGFPEEAARIARDISEAASYFVFHRLPELYAGIAREPGSFPVQYLGANVPQAWAAGSTFHFLRAILGLDADAHNNILYVDPVLPRWVPDITLHDLRVGANKVTLRFWREQNATRYDVISGGDALSVVHTREKELVL